MKDLIVSTISVALLIGAWFMFYSYSENQINKFTYEIESVIIPLVEEELWDDSNLHIDTLVNQWNRYRTFCLLFLDNDTVNEIDYSMARSVEYIQAKDVSNSSGELSSISRRLRFIVSNEEVSIVNIM